MTTWGLFFKISTCLITYSGAFDIPGYNFNSYTYNGASSTTRPDTSTTTMPYQNGATALNLYYKPSAQKVAKFIKSLDQMAKSILPWQML